MLKKLQIPDDKPAHYGKQRLWGSVGWGIFSLLTGTLIDEFSEGAYKDYTIAFILMFVFMSGDVVVSCFVKVYLLLFTVFSIKNLSVPSNSRPKRQKSRREGERKIRGLIT